MARNAFITPNTVRLDLAEGDWVEVKERLTYGEEQSLATAGMKTMSVGGGGEISIDMKEFSVQRLLMWVVAWSFVDETGRATKVNRAWVEALDPLVAEEIIAALDKYIEERDASGKSNAGESKPRAKSS